MIHRKRSIKIGYTSRGGIAKMPPLFDEILLVPVQIPRKYCMKRKKTSTVTETEEAIHPMAGAVRLELTTYGFGDRCSTN